MENLGPAAQRIYRNIALGVASAMIVVIGLFSIGKGTWLYIGFALPITIYLLITGVIAHLWTRSTGGRKS